jgi:hypothetical protein
VLVTVPRIDSNNIKMCTLKRVTKGVLLFFLQVMLDAVILVTAGDSAILRIFERDGKKERE